MTHFLKDILRQPEELQRTLEQLTGLAGAARGSLEAATAAVRGARHRFSDYFGEEEEIACLIG